MRYTLLRQKIRYDYMTKIEEIHVIRKKTCIKKYGNIISVYKSEPIGLVIKEKEI